MPGRLDVVLSPVTDSDLDADIIGISVRKDRSFDVGIAALIGDGLSGDYDLTGVNTGRLVLTSDTSYRLSCARTEQREGALGLRNNKRPTFGPIRLLAMQRNVVPAVSHLSATVLRFFLAKPCLPG